MKDVCKSDDTFNFWIVTIIEDTLNHDEFVFWDNIDFLDNLKHGIMLVNK